MRNEERGMGERGNRGTRVRKRNYSVICHGFKRIQAPDLSKPSSNSNVKANSKDEK